MSIRHLVSTGNARRTIAGVAFTYRNLSTCPSRLLNFSRMETAPAGVVVVDIAFLRITEF